MSIKTIPERRELRPEDRWDLSKLFDNDKVWEEGLIALETGIPKIADFKGGLSSSASALAVALDYVWKELGLLDERLGYYAMLRLSEDMGDNGSQDRYGRYMSVSSKLASASSWMVPEIQSIEDTVIRTFMEQEVLADYRVSLAKLLRFKPHILSEKEEALLAAQMESVDVPHKAFNALTNVDIDFGFVKTPDGPQPLTQSTYNVLLLNKDRKIREEAYKTFYAAFQGHRNTLAELYAGSVLRDKYLASVRNHSSARAMALFPDKVDEGVYDNLVNSVRSGLPALHEYYRLRARCLGLDKLRHWDLSVSLVDMADIRHTWDQAVDVICDALAPLGMEYVDTLRGGLLGTWADRYENKGKRSGAFSAGSYAGEPYIMMNFKEDTLRDVFTLAHEGGHSMHSWYSVRSNPFPHYQYSIFEAEVASTFNEELLAHRMMSRGADRNLKAYLVGKQIDDVIATIYRQTMFAEFERDTHSMVERGEALTVDNLRSLYRSLLEDYFGPSMILEEESDLECLRIPHFYRAFYVYKYATGLSASMALSRRVLDGGMPERDAYLAFLKSGGSRYPLESLALAGVDMSSPEPIDTALARFADLVKRFEELIA